MDDLNTPDEPLNPYSRAFFGTWAMVALSMIAFQVGDLPTQKSHRNQSDKGQADQTVRITQLPSVFYVKSAFFNQPDEPQILIHHTQRFYHDF